MDDHAIKPAEINGCHEAFNMTAVLIDMIDNYLLQYDLIQDNPEWSGMAQTAQSQLNKLLRSIGKAHLPALYSERAKRRYENDAYEERACDRCGKPYQGPAVYCSLTCALADA